MAVNTWDDIKKAITEILQNVERYEPKTRNKSCYLSAYQIALLLSKDYKSLIKNTPGCPKNIGGLGEGNYNSLSQYIVMMLSSDLDKGKLQNVEMGFFNTVELEQFSFRDEKGRLSEPSNTCFSMFRYIP